jgi:hypothetical protein
MDRHRYSSVSSSATLRTASLCFRAIGPAVSSKGVVPRRLEDGSPHEFLHTFDDLSWVVFGFDDHVPVILADVNFRAGRDADSFSHLFREDDPTFGIHRRNLSTKCGTIWLFRLITVQRYRRDKYRLGAYNGQTECRVIVNAPFGGELKDIFLYALNPINSFSETDGGFLITEEYLVTEQGLIL